MLRTLLTVLACILLAVDVVSRFAGVAHSQAAPFTRFAGDRFTHGGRLSITARGYGVFHVRTYNTCSRTIVTNCDRFKGNYIYPGGYGTFQLSRVSGNTAYGFMTGSSASWEIDTPIRFTLAPRGVLTAHGPSDLIDQRSFCTDQSPAGACGA